MCGLFFFFKQKTAYEMSIGDWSSDVCSSDLAGRARGAVRAAPPDGRAVRCGRVLARRDRPDPGDSRGDRALGGVPRAPPVARVAGGLEGGRMMQEPLPFDHRPDP